MDEENAVMKYLQVKGEEPMRMHEHLKPLKCSMKSFDTNTDCVIRIGNCLDLNCIAGSKRFSLDVEMMLGRRIPVVLSYMLSYITPVILFVSK